MRKSQIEKTRPKWRLNMHGLALTSYDAFWCQETLVKALYIVSLALTSYHMTRFKATRDWAVTGYAVGENPDPSRSSSQDLYKGVFGCPPNEHMLTAFQLLFKINISTIGAWAPLNHNRRNTLHSAWPRNMGLISTSQEIPESNPVLGQTCSRKI